MNSSPCIAGTIKPVPGHPFLFEVPSESGRDAFQVDLQARDYVGFCGCEDYEFRGPRRCKHLVAARDWLLDKFLRSLADQTGLTGGKED